MKIEIYDTKEEVGKFAAEYVEEIIRQAIKKNGLSVVVFATGTSQFEFLKNLTSSKSINWKKVIMFHLDEYTGIDEGHPASFRKYLKDRVIKKVKPGKVYLIDGSNPDSCRECQRLSSLIKKYKVDVTFCGIGENGHIAFNDPPADFKTEKPFIIVQLDRKCRKQQVKEGWFKSLKDVPQKAISMSVRQIMKSKNIVCIVIGKRKKEIVKKCFKSKVSPLYPASILKKHKNAVVYLDIEAGSGLF